MRFRLRLASDPFAAVGNVPGAWSALPEYPRGFSRRRPAPWVSDPAARCLAGLAGQAAAARQLQRLVLRSLADRALAGDVAAARVLLDRTDPVLRRQEIG